MAKTSLTDALSKAASRSPHFGRSEAPAVIMPNIAASQGVAAVATAAASQSSRSKGRVGKKVISGFFDPQASKQLARLAIDQDRSNEDLLREALNDLFTKYQLPPIA